MVREEGGCGSDEGGNQGHACVYQRGGNHTIQPKIREEVMRSDMRRRGGGGCEG